MWKRPPTAKLPDVKTPTAKTTIRGYDDSVRALYKSARWLKFRDVVKTCNPLCQRIINGEQCHNPAKIIHHIISPKAAPSLFLDWQNTVSVCSEHHPDTEGEPLNTVEPNRYAITHGILGATYDVNRRIAELRGDIVESSAAAPVTPEQVELNPSIDYRALMARHQKHTL